MNIFVLNAGSSSLKYQVIDTESEHIHTAGQVEGIGTGEGAPTHGDAVTQALESIPSGVVISAVGHRVVHGGEKFVDPTVITDDVVSALAKISPLAPLHNPANLEGIAVARAALPDVPHVAVFDTAFHHTLSAAAFTIPLPEEISESEGIRKYGFHGTSHQYVSRVASTLLGGALEDQRIITLHLGNGSSVAAIRGGKCIDTSMGFTPTSGLVMGTRSGDLDPGVLTHLLGGEHMNVSQAQEMVTQHSGLLALTGELRLSRNHLPGQRRRRACAAGIRGVGMAYSPLHRRLRGTPRWSGCTGVYRWHWGEFWRRKASGNQGA